MNTLNYILEKKKKKRSFTLLRPLLSHSSLSLGIILQNKFSLTHSTNERNGKKKTEMMMSFARSISTIVGHGGEEGGIPC